MQVISPPVPFWGHISGGLNPGTVIEINGHIPHECSKFEIALYCGNQVGHHAEKHSNIALQIEPKIHKKKLICNSRHNGHWGSKEKFNNFHHVHHGSNFTLQIIVEHQHYRIVTNGYEACLFHHRIPFQEVRVLSVEGHVSINRIEYRNQYSAMPSAPAYPTQPPNYMPPQQVYQPPAVSYPAPPMVYSPPQSVYVAPPIVQPSYVPSTVIIEERHHGHHHHHGGGLIGAIEHAFDHHHHHGHHGHHHHGHHY